MSTAFHPQTDGQTERTNSILEQYLRVYLNYQQDDWISLLPLAEFSYNNSIQSSTRHSPFMANYGFHPRFTFTPQSTNPGIAASSETFCNNLQALHKTLQEELKLAQQQQAAYYNEYHRPTPEYQIGDSVYLSSKNIKTLRPSDKLDYKRLGPFKILAKVGSHAYKLELPSTMKIHPVFHVNLLTPKEIPHLPDIPGRVSPPNPPIEVEGEEHFEVEYIKDSRKYNRQVQYLVKWKGYENPNEDTWEPIKNLWNCLDVIRDFHRAYPNKPCARQDLLPSFPSSNGKDSDSTGRSRRTRS